MKRPTYTQKEVPTVFQTIIKVEHFRKFNWAERLQILCGAGVVQVIGVACQHSPGKIQPLVVGKVSRHETPEEHLRAIVRNMLEEREKQP